jgi:hypothetical protein
VIKNPRLLIHALIGLIVGTLLASAIQAGENILRYLVQPVWLEGAALLALLVAGAALGGLIIGGSIGFAIRFGLKREGHGRCLVIWPMVAGFAIAYMLDPYFLAAMGWRGPVMLEGLARGLALVPAIIALVWAAHRLDRLPLRALFLVVVAMIGAAVIHGGMERFSLIPILGGDLDLALLSPIHSLVFLRGMLFLLIAYRFIGIVIARLFPTDAIVCETKEP